MTDTTTTCTLCSTKTAIYTCPRCSFKSCSLDCSNAHKALTDPPCSGVRDRAAYVPMNQYGYGTMVDDYVFLEDMGRKVEEWGRDIVRGKIANRGTSARVGKPMRGGRDGGRGRGHGARPGMDRKGFLSMQLSFRNVDMDVLPDGMERHRTNQSTWDSKKQTALLTLELVFHANLASYPRANTPFRLLAHKNDWSQSLREIARGQLSVASKIRKDEDLVRWVDALVGMDDDEDGQSPLCVMRRPRSADLTVLQPSQISYFKLEWRAKLSEVLHSTQFVEFPTIEIMDACMFTGILADGDRTRDYQEHRQKRRRVDTVAGKKALTSLVGGYGSDESSEDDYGHVRDAMADVANYDSDVNKADGPEIDVDDDEDAEGDIDLMLDEDDFHEILNGVTSHPDGTVPGAIAVIEEEEEAGETWGDSDGEAALDLALKAASASNATITPSEVGQTNTS